MHGYVSNVGFNRNSSKKARFNENRVPLAFKETGSTPDIYWKVPSLRVRNLHYQRDSKPHGVSFSVFLFVCLFFLCSRFSVFLLFCEISPPY